MKNKKSGGGRAEKLGEIDRTESVMRDAKPSEYFEANQKHFISKKCQNTTVSVKQVYRHVNKYIDK